MFKDLANTGPFPITGAEIVINILVALMCGLSIAWLYRHTYKGPGLQVTFANSLVLLTMITAVVIMTIGSNLARAFGLVGAMSIIRFRTAVKDIQDLVFIFFALSIGLAAGVGYYNVAVIGTLAISVMIYLFAKTKASAPRREEYLLQFSYSPNGDDTPGYVPVFQKYCRRSRVVNARAVGVDGERLEVSFYVRLRDKTLNSHFIRELQRTHGVGQVNLYFDEEEF